MIGSKPLDGALLNNHIPWQAKILNCLARIAQQERECALHQARQPLAILAGHDALVPDKIGYVGGIQRITLRLNVLQQGWDIWLFHEWAWARHARGAIS